MVLIPIVLPFFAGMSLGGKNNKYVLFGENHGPFLSM